MSRKSIIATAAAEDGIKENPSQSNKTKYGEWYNLNGVPWCAIFVSWVYNKAGHPLGKIDSSKGYHYCPSAYNFWKANNRVTTTPQPGDIIFFDWNGDGKCDHTGIFIGWIVEGKTFTSWEGNTSVGNDSDGGQVMMRTRSKSTVKAFVNPGIFNNTFDTPSTTLKVGDTGADVARIQKILFDLKYDIVVDGSFGAGTKRILKQFQKEHGLSITGIADVITEGALEAELSKPKVANAKAITGAFLKKGDSGAVVLTLQKALNKNGAKPKLIEDGVFGTGTVLALSKFQKSKRLTIDGIAGPETMKNLGIDKL